MLGEFNGIAEEMLQNLQDTLCIAVESRWNTRLNILSERQFFVPSRIDELQTSIIEQIFERKLAWFDQKIPGFQSGQVENVVEQLHELMRSLADAVQALACIFRGNIAFEQVRQSKDCIHRGPDFMAHVGQKTAFRTAGSFCCLLCLSELLCSFVDQGFQFFPILRQFGLTTLKCA